MDLLELSKRAVRETFDSTEPNLPIAFLLPFVGRLSCSVQGDIVTHVKRGGICVYQGWEDDFLLFLRVLSNSLESIARSSINPNHTILYGDARTFRFPKKRFRAMLTSPPYPNHRDFVSMFAPEHAFLDLIRVPGSVNSRRTAEQIIGSNFISARPVSTATTKTARDFIQSIGGVKRNATAVRHDRQYYIPYFENYFADLETAYRNVASALALKSQGYIVVVNNTHRNLVIPVAQAIVEIWESLGFKASIWASTEAFHVGTKNPRARGLRARHTEHVVRIWR
jgi:hypothetical protein